MPPVANLEYDREARSSAYVLVLGILDHYFAIELTKKGVSINNRRDLSVHYRPVRRNVYYVLGHKFLTSKGTVTGKINYALTFMHRDVIIKINKYFMSLMLQRENRTPLVTRDLFSNNVIKSSFGRRYGNAKDGVKREKYTVRYEKVKTGVRTTSTYGVRRTKRYLADKERLHRGAIDGFYTRVANFHLKSVCDVIRMDLTIHLMSSVVAKYDISGVLGVRDLADLVGDSNMGANVNLTFTCSMVKHVALRYGNPLTFSTRIFRTITTCKPTVIGPPFHMVTGLNFEVIITILNTGRTRVFSLIPIRNSLIVRGRGFTTNKFSP